ncbi:MAG: hypothetical protein COA97_13425 [Flavobacteriales bacterium]|nr:MAG: hypothetical protein COA97_13425 [Flavobacteriales bacterium]
MLRFAGIFVLILCFCQGILSQDVSGSHDVSPGNEPNEYNIKTTIKGLQGVDIARIKYIIDNKHTYKASPNNGLFSDRNEKYIKFYIMAVPVSGELVVELGIVVADGKYSFPVEFQFSRNEEKQTINLPNINISNGEILAVVEEIPEVVPESVVVEEVEPIVEEVPEVVPEPVVEEVAVVVEEELEVVHEPVVVEEVEPVEEEKPEVVSEPVVEEVPEIIEDSEPITRVVKENPIPVTISKTTVKYTVQLLSLAKFSQSRLNIFCKQHNLSMDDIKKKQVGSWMKITYGEANSIQEANDIMKKLIDNNNINEAFVTVIK